MQHRARHVRPMSVRPPRDRAAALPPSPTGPSRGPETPAAPPASLRARPGRQISRNGLPTASRGLRGCPRTRGSRTDATVSSGLTRPEFTTGAGPSRKPSPAGQGRLHRDDGRIERPAGHPPGSATASSPTTSAGGSSMRSASMAVMQALKPGGPRLLGRRAALRGQRTSAPCSMLNEVTQGTRPEERHQLRRCLERIRRRARQLYPVRPDFAGQVRRLRTRTACTSPRPARASSPSSRAGTSGATCSAASRRWCRRLPSDAAPKPTVAAPEVRCPSRRGRWRALSCRCTAIRPFGDGRHLPVGCRCNRSGTGPAQTRARGGQPASPPRSSFVARPSLPWPPYR